MAKYNLELKTSVKNELGIETHYVKKIIDESELATQLSTFATVQGVEFITLRKVQEQKPKAPVKKEAIK